MREAGDGFGQIKIELGGILNRLEDLLLEAPRAAVPEEGLPVPAVDERGRVAIALSSEWPPAAKPVPLTACYMALTAACLNLINELFGKEQSLAARGNVDGGVAGDARPAVARVVAPSISAATTVTRNRVSVVISKEDTAPRRRSSQRDGYFQLPLPTMQPGA